MAYTPMKGAAQTNLRDRAQASDPWDAQAFERRLRAAEESLSRHENAMRETGKKLAAFQEYVQDVATSNDNTRVSAISTTLFLSEMVVAVMDALADELHVGAIGREREECRRMCEQLRATLHERPAPDPPCPTPVRGAAVPDFVRLDDAPPFAAGAPARSVGTPAHGVGTPAMTRKKPHLARRRQNLQPTPCRLFDTDDQPAPMRQNDGWVEFEDE